MKGRRRKWKAPNNPTPQSRLVWAKCFPGEPWPSGWRVEWVGFMRGALALTSWDERCILLSYGDHAGRAIITRRNHFIASAEGTRPATKLRALPVETLLHEFVHVRCPALRHGKEFNSLVTGLRRRIGLEEA